MLLGSNEQREFINFVTAVLLRKITLAIVGGGLPVI